MILGLDCKLLLVDCLFFIVDCQSIVDC